MVVSATQLKKLQKQVRKLREENTRLKRQLRGNEKRGKTTGRHAPPNKKRIVKLGGLWAGTPEITEQDIANARREIWANFGQRDL